MKNNLITTLLFPLLLVLAETVAYLSTDMYLPALPQIANTLQASPNLVQMTLTAWFLGSASLQLFLGPLSDYLGRKPILLAGGVIFVLSTLACALTNHIMILLFARFMQGTTVAFVIVAGYASIHESFDQKRAIQTLAWMNSVSILAPAFGPLIGGILLNFQSYHFIFWLLGTSALILFLLLAKFMPETNPNGKIEHPLELKKTLKSYEAIIRNPFFLRYVLIFCFIFGAFIAWIAYSPFLFIEKMGYSPFMYGCFQTLVFGAFIIGTRLIKVLMEKYHLNTLIMMGVSCALTGGLLSILFSLFTTSWFALVVPLALFAFGAGLIFAPLNRLAIESSEEPMGKKVAVFSSMMGLFCVTGSMLASFFYNGTSINLAFIVGISAIISFGINLNTKTKKQAAPY